MGGRGEESEWDGGEEGGRVSGVGVRREESERMAVCKAVNVSCQL